MRILLPRGKQRKFIEDILLKISTLEAAKLCNLSERTIRDWRREKFLMQKSAMISLSKETKTSLPKNFEEKDDYWYANPYLGYVAVMKKHGKFGGNSEYRKKKWREWWDKKGKFENNPLFKRKSIYKPRKSKELSEFIGIMLGDGGISNWKQQIRITLNNRDDKEYIKFVYNLTKKLFRKKPSILKRKDSMASDISVSSMNLVDYLITVGLKPGNKFKLQVDIPNWIKDNRAYSIACVRGLVDTDGCIFKHTYIVNNKMYAYKKLSFVSYSQPLRKSVYEIFRSLGITSRLYSNRDVRIDSQKDMWKYFKIIGSHNPKHLNRYHK